jgi:Putative MetA-pathway of phenol degradation
MPRLFESTALGILCGGILALRVAGQSLDKTEIVTDRPDVTESAIVVPRGSLQAENGITWTSNRSNNMVATCQSLLRFGLTDNTELRLATPGYQFGVYGTNAASGFSDLSIGLKQQLVSLSSGFDLSVILAASLPTGSVSQTSHRVDPFVKFPWSHELGRGWSIGGMASLFWPTEQGHRNLTWEPTFVLEREIIKPIDIFAEYAGDYSQTRTSRQIVHFGMSYRITAKSQIDSHFGFGVSSGAPGRFFAVGYSFRLDHLWARQAS